MNKTRLEKLAERYQKKADTAYMNYQETGITRYDTQRRNNEELADALRMAAAAADEHNKYICLRADFADVAGRAQQLSYASESIRDDLTQKLVRDIIAIGVMKGVIRKEL